MKIIDLSGVTIQIPKGYFYRQFERFLTEKAEAYRHSTVAKARSSPNPYIFFKYLWSGKAVQGITYGLEAGPVSIACLNKLEIIQSKMAKSILDIPLNSQNWVSYIGLGLKPIWYYTYLNICNFFIKTFEREGNYIGDNLKVELESLNSSSPMVSRVKYILSKIDADINDDIEMKLNEYVVKSVNATLEKNCKTSFVIPKISYLDLNDPPLQRPQGISCKQMKSFTNLPS